MCYIDTRRKLLAVKCSVVAATLIAANQQNIFNGSVRVCSASTDNKKLPTFFDLSVFDCQS